jgi:hypothetical protein
MNRIEKYGIEKTNGNSKIYELPDKNTQIDGAPETSKPRSRTQPNPKEDEDGIE